MSIEQSTLGIHVMAFATYLLFVLFICWLNMFFDRLNFKDIDFIWWSIQLLSDFDFPTAIIVLKD